MSDQKKPAIDLDTLGVPPGPTHPCSYIKGREAQERACRIDEVPQGFYFLMMNHGWRRSGPLFYKTACNGCDECRPIRVDVPAFKPNRTQRKLLRKNSDLRVKAIPPTATDEKFDLFIRYQEGRHEGTMCTEREEFENFLYSSPLKTKEFEFYLDNKIIASAIVDFDAMTMSAVYSYYDPDYHKRSLGTYMVLYLLTTSAKFNYKFLYLGYYIDECRKMNYKKNFRPCEVLDVNKEWIRFD